MSKDRKEVDKQIAKANNLSNALLSGLLVTVIEENKKNLKFNSSLEGLLGAVQAYDTEIGRLK